MKYIIADPDEQSCIDLVKILGDNPNTEFLGRFTSLELLENCMKKESLDFAFIRGGEPKLNAVQFVNAIRRSDSFLKVIFISTHVEYAVEAFECDADEFLMLPFSRNKVEQLLLRCQEK